VALSRKPTHHVLITEDRLHDLNKGQVRWPAYLLWPEIFCYLDRLSPSRGAVACVALPTTG
jgi:hypothetical protein